MAPLQERLLPHVLDALRLAEDPQPRLRQAGGQLVQPQVTGLAAQQREQLYPRMQQQNLR